MYIYICISSSLQEDILFLLKERRASMQRGDMLWTIGRGCNEAWRGKAYIGVKSEPASLERAAAGFKKLLLGGER